MTRRIGQVRPRPNIGRLTARHIVVATTLITLAGISLAACGGSEAGAASGGNTTSSVSVSVSSSSSVAAADPCAGSYVLCDDFNGAAIDTAKWQVGNTNIAHQHKVRPENVSLKTYDDNGTSISVVDTAVFGDRHSGARRQGGVLISRAHFGGGRYETRMKPLPGPNGCSCFWNYYDSDNETRPPATRVYTEIDIEMPAHVPVPPAWDTWKRTLGLNTWSHTDADSDATYLNPVSAIDPFDGQFHVFRWDWRDGGNGTLRIDWYVDNVLQASTTEHVGTHSAELWVGAWPAPWAGMDYDFDTAHLYIDWVRISALP